MRKTWTMMFLVLVAVLIMGNVAPAIGQSLPPEYQVDDLKSIAGAWDGILAGGPRGDVPYRLFIQEDGAWKAVSPNGVSTGTAWVVDRQAKFKSKTTGRTGVYRLHEGGGNRFLVLEGEGNVTAQLKPLKE